MMSKDWIGKWADYLGDKKAIYSVHQKRTEVYATINQKGEQLALNLYEAGLRKGDRIGVIAEFCIEYIYLLAASQKVGFVLVPINYRLSKSELKYIINDASPKLLFVQDQLIEKVPQKSELPSVDYLMMTSLLEDLFIKKSSVLTTSLFEEFVVDEDDPLFILYTSGTTGFPKGALYTHKMMFWNAVNTGLRLGITDQDHTLICVPPFHTGGWNVMLTPMFFHGGSATILSHFDIDLVFDLLEYDQITQLFLVPTMLKLMCDHKRFKRAVFPKLQFIITGGEALPLSIIDLWKEKGIDIRQGFGMTEVGPNIFSLHHDDAIRKIGSIGTPNFYTQIKLIDDDGKEVNDGEKGELVCKGDLVTPGYWNNPEATQKAFINGWFKTGDVLTRDAEGFYYVVDRKKHMFISGGENVYPSEVEKVLMLCDGVKDVVVTYVPDEKWGEVGFAFVIQQEGDELSKDQLQSHCLGHLAKFKHPKHYQMVSQFPVGQTGKIDRITLKKEAETMVKEVSTLKLS
ncbi:long-chain fatty acid--CoA ligase [Flammeovirga sp. MY04]|nr:long-chain fatty acid--CoA ligase [Flammeovirga sp. MY04]